MNGSRSDSFAQELFGTLPSRYDVLAEALSFGQNRRWRAKLTERLTRGQPRRVLDVATGTAGVALAIARRTDARLVGLDVTPAMLREAQANLRGAGLMKCVQLVAGSAECLPFPSASFDAVSFTYLLRYVGDPAATLVELTRVLEPSGWMASLEFFVPSAAVSRANSSN